MPYAREIELIRSILKKLIQVPVIYDAMREGPVTQRPTWNHVPACNSDRAIPAHGEDLRPVLMRRDYRDCAGLHIMDRNGRRPDDLFRWRAGLTFKLKIQLVNQPRLCLKV